MKHDQSMRLTGSCTPIFWLAALAFVAAGCESDPTDLGPTGGTQMTGGMSATGGVSGGAGVGGAPLGGGPGRGTGGIVGLAGQGGGGAAIGTGGTGSGGTSGGCGPNQFCETAAGSCGKGPCKCVTKFEVCNLIYAPVCGCDGMTYGNDCGRQGAGVSKASDGECQTADDHCAKLEVAYKEALARGTTCNPNLKGQCQQLHNQGLACPLCPLVVNDATELDAIAAKWKVLCGGAANRPGGMALPVPCPAIACVLPQTGICKADPAGGGMCRQF